jgi:interleukin-1 receptor-associated kinase 1
VVAVRRLHAPYWQSFQFHELKDVLVLAAKLKHDNIVQLLGVCLEQREKLLVYEYLPRPSLGTILFGKLITQQSRWYMNFLAPS